MGHGVETILRRSTQSLGDTKIVTSRLAAGDERLLSATNDDQRIRLHAVIEGSLGVTLHGSAVARDVHAGAAIWSGEGQRLAVRAVSDTVVHTIVAPLSLLNLREQNAAARVIERQDSALLEPVFAFIQHTASIALDDATAVDVYYLERLLHEMLLALKADADQPVRATHADQAFTRAMAVVKTEFADPAISTQSVAAHARVSPRQLERVFRAHGTTIMGEVRRARLAHASGLLGDERFAQHPIGRIARASGFSNGSSLARALKAAGLGTPNELRAQATPSKQSLVGT